jgi:spermidine/putrescine transport system permease protein
MADDLRAVNPRARLFQTILSVYGIGIYIFLFAPIAVLILLSFNASSVVGFPMAGFTTDWYAMLPNDTVILDALSRTLLVAFWVTVLSTLIGTTAAFPLVRANIKNRGGVRVFITLPIMMPGLLIGVAILVLASNVLHIQPSLKVAIIGQTVLATPFVILVVSSRLEALDRNFERAAADLGAGPLQRLLFVVLPLVYPGIIAGALIAATLSLDEFVVTNFIIGADQTLPIYIYNQLKFGITPEVNALATMMLLGTLAVVGVTFGALRLVKVLATVAKRSKQVEEVEAAEEAIEHSLLVARARDV